MHRIVLDDLGTSLETKKEIILVTTAINPDNTCPQAVKVYNAVDEEQTINHLISSNYHIIGKGLHKVDVFAT
jgi:hypothetical protein